MFSVKSLQTGGGQRWLETSEEPEEDGKRRLAWMNVPSAILVHQWRYFHASVGKRNTSGYTLPTLHT